MGRMVVQFSCGAASAVAAKLTLAAYPPDQVLIVNAFIHEEHPDNRRFFADCERWFGHPVTVLKDEKYGASTHEVWRRRKFMKGREGAPCSLKLKRELLATVCGPDDTKVIGFTADEWERADALIASFPGERFSFPLIDKHLTKEDCYSVVDRAGLILPQMYLMGYDNANCIGCVKGGQAYWQNIRADFPEQFVQIQKIQEDIGPGANFLQFRSGPKKGQRMPLSELPEGRGDMKGEPSFSCSFYCDLATKELGGN